MSLFNGVLAQNGLICLRRISENMIWW